MEKVSLYTDVLIIGGGLAGCWAAIGAKAKGEAKLSHCIHPEVIGLASSFGHWARRLLAALGRGIHFNSLVPYGLDHMDPVSVGIDLCIRVKVYRASSKGNHSILPIPSSENKIKI